MAAHAQAPVTGTATVVVGCKLPNGLIMELFEKRTINEVTMGGSKSVDQYFATGERFTLNGPAHKPGESAGCMVRSGFAITRGIPKDFWDRWYSANKTLPAVVNGLIVAYDSLSKTADAANERKAQKTGQERIDPKNIPILDPRLRMKTSEDQKAKIIEEDEE
jgi:hypothetical protein